MLLEKNTLFGLLLLWFTGCRAVSPGHLPFCTRASISVPGAPASSLATGSQLLVVKPGRGDLRAGLRRDRAALHLPARAPRFEMSLAPVSAMSWDG